MNNTVYGGFISIFTIPLEQVERIEVIRGPGSALYGKWAYAGIINVTTRKKANRIFGKIGDYNEKSFGAMASYENPDRKFDIGLNVSGWSRDATDIYITSDILGDAPFSLAPEKLNDSVSNATAVFTMNYDRLSLIGQWMKLDYGSHIGVSGAAPPYEDRKPVNEENRMIEAKYEFEIVPSLKVELNGGFRNEIIELDRIWFSPPGYTFPNPKYDPSITHPTDMRSYPYFIYPNGIQYGSYFDEEAYFGGLTLTWTGFDRHILLMGAEFESIDMVDFHTSGSADPLTRLPLPAVRRYVEGENWLKKKMERKIIGLLIQDQFAVNDHLTITTGLRYDDYDDAEDRLTPRIAAVFRLTPQHIFKAQYAEAYRPPSFMEKYTRIFTLPSYVTSELKPETVQTWESGYTYKSRNATLKFTLFYSLLENLISVDPNANFLYVNKEGGESRGAEIELDWRWDSVLSFFGNVSYIDTEEDQTGEEFMDTIHWLGNAGLLYHPAPDIGLSVQYRYVGEQSRVWNDPRNELAGYQTVNIAGTYKNLLIDGFTVRAGISNLFDETVRYPFHVYQSMEDFPQTGRRWWVSASYEL